MERILIGLEKVSAKRLNIFLFVVGFITYIPILFNGFVWDDIPQIIENTLLQNLSNLFALFAGSTFYGGAGTGLIGDYYKPLMPLVFMFISTFFGVHAFYFHLVDVLFHGINGILVFLFLKKVFAYIKVDFAKTLAFVLSFLFLIHPVNVESVAYISSTQELLYTGFMLTSLLLIFGLKERFSLKKCFFLVLSLLASILSKESGFIGFILVMLLSLVLHNPKKKYIFGSVIIAGVVYILLRFVIARVWFISASPLIPIQIAPFSVRLQTMPYEIFSYLRLLIFPKDLFIFQDEVISSTSDPRFYLLLPITVFVIGTLLMMFIHIKKGFFRFFLLWIVLGFGLLLNIIPLDMTIAERWVYGPFIGILGVLGIGIVLLTKQHRWVLAGVLFLVIFLTPFYLMRDYTREFIWHDNKTLFFHDVRLETTSARLYNDVGIMSPQNEEAEVYYKKSVTLNPNQYQAYDNLGIVYNKEDNLQKSKLAFLLSMEHGALVSTYLNYAIVLIQHKEYQNAVNFLQYRAIFLFSKNPQLYQLLAQAYTGLGDRQKANAANQKAASLTEPSFMQNYHIDTSQNQFIQLTQ